MCRIEYCISELLVWEDVAVFSAAHALPSHDGFFWDNSACPVVADHTAQHSVVRGGDVVVLID